MATKRFAAERLLLEQPKAAHVRGRAAGQADPAKPVATPLGMACTACQGAAGPCPACAAAAGAVGGRHARQTAGTARDAAAPLALGPVGDPGEREADRVADRVMRMGIPAPLPISRTAGAGVSGAVDGPARVPPGALPAGLGSGGQSLDPATRAFMEPRLGRDLGQIRLHTDGRAAESARALDAAAYTAGRDIVFGAGRYAPETGRGRHLLAHELTHAVQQGGGAPAVIQRASLTDYQDTDPLHDPSKLTDTEIRATDEYKLFSAFVVPPRIVPEANAAQALLAARLLLRHLREGGALTPWSDEGLAREFIGRAKAQLGVLGAATTLVGDLNWVPFSTAAAVSNPAALPTEFGRWVLAGGPEPNAVSGRINCWEMVLFGAFRGGFLSFARIQAIYNLAVANVRAGTTRSVGDTVETELRNGTVNIFDPTNPDSPEPLPGDVVIFNTAATHAAISLGTKTLSGEHRVLSLWNQPNAVSHVQRTTIEALVAAAGAAATPVRFWNARWG